MSSRPLCMSETAAQEGQYRWSQVKFTHGTGVQCHHGIAIALQHNRQESVTRPHPQSERISPSSGQHFRCSSLPVEQMVFPRLCSIVPHRRLLFHWTGEKYLLFFYTFSTPPTTTAEVFCSCSTVFLLWPQRHCRRRGKPSAVLALVQTPRGQKWTRFFLWWKEETFPLPTSFHLFFIGTIKGSWNKQRKMCTFVNVLRRWVKQVGKHLESRLWPALSFLWFFHV